jgi:hypothetical protein
VKKKTVRNPSGIKKAVVLNDLHIPYQDDACIDLFFQVLDHLGKDTRVVLNGDVIDGSEFSGFTHPLEMVPWHEESRQLHNFLKRLKDYQVDYLMGNHEERIREVICKQDRARGVKDLKDGKDVVIETLDLGKYKNLKSHPVGAVLRLGSLNITHGEGRPSGEAGNFGRRYVQMYGKSVLVGHSHRRGVTPKTLGAPDAQTEIVGIENGCMCRTTCWYKGGSTSANWQRCFSVVYYEDNTENGYFQVVTIPLVHYKFIFDEKVFSV